MPFQATSLYQDSVKTALPAMADVKTEVGARNVTFLLMPSFSMLAFASAVEPLRAANEITNKRMFDWHLVSGDGAPVRSSSGIEIPVAGALDRALNCWAVVVCGGQNSHLSSDRWTEACLRRLRFRGAKIGAISDGTYVLANAGLLDGSNCTIHWNCIEGFAETYPDIKLDDAIYHIDGDRFTCSGGTASLDLMLKLIELEFDRSLAMSISEQFLHSGVRDSETRQRHPKPESYQLANTHLGKAIRIMEQNLEETCSLEAICRAVGISDRNLQRQFSAHTKSTPRQYYMKLRLQRARSLLASTNMTITEVAVASGFISVSHFAKRYKRLYGATPREERRRIVSELIQRSDPSPERTSRLKECRSRSNRVT